jgi:hypothetical protein
MQLKRTKDVEYLDLPKLESPFFAKQWAESNLNTNDFGTHMVQGLNEVTWDPLDHHRQVWDDYAYSLLLQRLEKAEVLLIHGHGSEPLVPMLRRGTGDDRDKWHINNSLSHEQQFNVEWMLHYAEATKGIWAPLEQSETESPTPEPVNQEEPEELTVTNPRWEHVDGKRKEDSPDKTMAGDTVTLMADVTGTPDGTRITFRIFDTAVSPPGRIAVVRGKVEGGVGTAEWEVKARRDGTKPEFEGEVRRISSEKRKIPILKEFAFSV